MKKIITVILLISLISCKEKPKTNNQSNKTIYDSNNVVKVDGIVSFKRDMTKVTGIVHGFHSNGNPKEAYRVLNGKLDGFSNSWNDSGQQRFEGFYKKGEKDGLWKFWWPNGQLKAESRYENGMLNGVSKRWNNYGELISEDYWVNNNKQ